MVYQIEKMQQQSKSQLLMMVARKAFGKRFGYGYSIHDLPDYVVGVGIGAGSIVVTVDAQDPNYHEIYDNSSRTARRFYIV